MEELLYKINQFRDFLEIEHAYCLAFRKTIEEKTFRYIIEEWNEIFDEEHKI